MRQNAPSPHSDTPAATRSLQRAPHKAVMALADAPDTHVSCPWCARGGIAEPGRLEAYEQRVGDMRVIHIWCTRDDDHTTCVSGARETVFVGVPDIAARRAPASPKPKRAFPAANESSPTPSDSPEPAQPSTDDPARASDSADMGGVQRP